MSLTNEDRKLRGIRLRYFSICLPQVDIHDKTLLSIRSLFYFRLSRDAICMMRHVVLETPIDEVSEFRLSYLR